jgi:sigma-54 dependent transcriptional regulator, acetoin dehydrogenase operon transcriptional activator AcoR
MSYSKEKHDEIIKKSHERSAKYGVEKERVYSNRIIKGRDFSEHIKENRELIHIAAPFMEIIYDFLKQSGFFIVLTDKEGCILGVIGDKEIMDAAKEMNLAPGAYMDEKSIGTNAMGTAIKEDMPIQVSAKEHFITAYHRWTCSAAPIHGSQGELIGTLNLTGNSDKVHPHTLGLVVAAVKSIENQINNLNIQKELSDAYQYMNTIMNAISYGIFAVDTSDTIKSVNETACKMLGIGQKDIIGKSVQNIVSNWSYIKKYIQSGNEYKDEEIYFKNVNVKERYIMNAYPINGQPSNLIGIVITIKGMQSIYNLVNKYTGMRARYTFSDIIADCDDMLRIIEYSRAVADSPSTILIQGESGTGKEIFAQSIHNASSRKDMGFVAINCGAIPRNLIESELFGYDEGAFTGAKRGGHPGKFELANGGTLFLDEIGEMPLDMQVNLLRVIQEGLITRIGGNKYIPINVRIIAATNKDLKQAVKNGSFREDLYYRLSVIPIMLPPLRERKKDIPALVKSFLEGKALKLGKAVPKIDNSILSDIMNYNWPGNVRELENYIENLVNFNGKATFVINGGRKEFVNKESVYAISEEDGYHIPSIEVLEKRAIEDCLKKFKGNISKSAEILGISRNTLYVKIRKHNIIY